MEFAFRAPSRNARLTALATVMKFAVSASVFPRYSQHATATVLARAATSAPQESACRKYFLPVPLMKLANKANLVSQEFAFLKA
jgi:hypothetical protein